MSNYFSPSCPDLNRTLIMCNYDSYAHLKLRFSCELNKVLKPRPTQTLEREFLFQRAKVNFQMSAIEENQNT